MNFVICWLWNLVVQDPKYGLQDTNFITFFFFFSLGKFMTRACRTPFGIVKTQLWTYLLPESFDAHIMFKVVCLAYPKGSIACAFRISNLEFKKRNFKFVAFLIQNSTCIERFWSQVCPELCFQVVCSGWDPGRPSQQLIVQMCLLFINGNRYIWAVHIGNQWSRCVRYLLIIINIWTINCRDRRSRSALQGDAL